MQSPATHKTLSGVLLVLAIILTTTAAKALLTRSKWLGRSRQVCVWMLLLTGKAPETVRFGVLVMLHGVCVVAYVQADHTLPCSASVPTPESCLYLQIWYEAAKKAVLTIGERTLSSAVTRRTDSLEGDPEIEALLDTLW